MTGKTVLLLGAGGMLGHQVLRELSSDFDLIGAVRRGAARLRAFAGSARIEEGIDLTHMEGIRALLNDIRPATVVNCAGLIKQRSEASDPLALFRVNSLLPHDLASLCDAADARLIHFSTDCVFSGRKDAMRGPNGYRESDLPDPSDWYGRTKLIGEVGGRHLTIRASLIGRELDSRNGLVEWFLANRGGAVNGFTQALYTGLTTPVAGRLVAFLLARRTDLAGIYHVASAPINKFELLRLINETGRLGTRIQPTDGYFCDRRLDGSAFAHETGWSAPSWPQMVEEMLVDFEEHQRGSNLAGSPLAAG